MDNLIEKLEGMAITVPVAFKGKIEPQAVFLVQSL